MNPITYFIIVIIYIVDCVYFLFRYGYVTNTKIKFVVIVESSHTTLRDNEIRQVSLSLTSVFVKFDNNITRRIFYFSYHFRCLEEYIQDMQIWCVIHFMCLVKL